MDRLTCDICPRSCKLANDQTGFCGTRQNKGGKNVDRWYQLVDTAPTSPWEGYTVNFPGCNLRCPFCLVPASRPTENQLSRYRLIDEKQLAFIVESLGEKVIAFFGGEPTTHSEYVLEAIRLCRERGLFTVLQTNGYVSPWLAEKLAKAANYTDIGIKASASPDYYRTKMGADVSACLEATRIFAKNCKASTITNLIGPGLAVPDDDLRFARWILDNLGPDYPVQLLPLHDNTKTQGVWPWNHTPPAEPWIDVLKRIIATIERFNSCGARNMMIPPMYRDVFTGKVRT